MVDAGPLPTRGEPTLAESRAQFVGSLGRRRDALRQAITALEQSLDGGAADASSIEWDRTEDVDRAAQIVRITAPEVAIVDADHGRARELVETLVNDPLLDPIRIVAVGTIEKPDAAAALLA